MNKKLLINFLSLFLIGILSMSCSNKTTKPEGDTTKPEGGTTIPEDIKKHIGTYQSAKQRADYLWVSISKDGKIAIKETKETEAPQFNNYMDLTPTQTNYSFETPDDRLSGTLSFDGKNIKVMLTKYAGITNPEFQGKEVICTKKE